MSAHNSPIAATQRCLHDILHGQLPLLLRHHFAVHDQSQQDFKDSIRSMVVQLSAELYWRLEQRFDQFPFRLPFS